MLYVKIGDTKSVFSTKIKAYRDVVTQVLGFDISSADGATYKFLSVYAQERSDSVVRNLFVNFILFLKLH